MTAPSHADTNSRAASGWLVTSVGGTVRPHRSARRSCASLYRASTIAAGWFIHRQSSPLSMPPTARPASLTTKVRSNADIAGSGWNSRGWRYQMLAVSVRSMSGESSERSMADGCPVP